MPHTGKSTVIELVRQQKKGFSAYWREVKSGPSYALIVVAGAIIWAFLIAWIVLPPLPK